MQKLDYLRQKKLNPADGLREYLHNLEQRHLNFKSMTPTQTLILLRELDQVYALFEEIESNGVSLLPERGRFKAIEAQLKKSGAGILKALGGPAALAKYRPKSTPAREQWWWYLDETVGIQQKRRLQIMGGALLTIILLFGGVVFAFRTVLAPSPEARIGFEVENEANEAIEEQDYRGALAAVDEGLTKLPGDPGFLIYKGVLHQILGEEAEADQAFDQAQNQLDAVRFHIARSQLQLRLSQAERAEADARMAIELDEKSARAWLLLGQALQLQGRDFEAIPVYERAGQIALENGDNEIVVLARLALGQIGTSSINPQ